MGNCPVAKSNSRKNFAFFLVKVVERAIITPAPKHFSRTKSTGTSRILNQNILTQRKHRPNATADTVAKDKDAIDLFNFGEGNFLIKILRRGASFGELRRPVAECLESPMVRRLGCSRQKQTTCLKDVTDSSFHGIESFDKTGGDLASLRNLHDTASQELEFTSRPHLAPIVSGPYH